MGGREHHPSQSRPMLRQAPTMRFFLMLSCLASLCLAAAATAEHKHVPLPQFEALFSVNLQVLTESTFQGPFGTRVHSMTSGGNLTNATTGEIVGQVLQNQDNGLYSTSGIFFPSVVLPVVWAADQKLGSIFITGVGVGETVKAYLHLETESPKWSSLNSRFLIANLVYVPPAANITIFGEL
ncbi:hypothetical protein DICSQDRAFT_88484 [Dichomitus squalens LYAD-421 SS1]|uniref:Dirigent protein n=1 Tax=Dichomitus squalens (strain LYAD-421) TaxID=732165 RepID=R7SYF5_DICSQ|nr:uncharacterized protein DICSQDRAFT_88484 [Dichomitus squalens LYAD-421 SS1]EJF60022.1 hypothetical protein DICSQDRAFT_88484 [Dichomitus squalens LYAD-421 SS1]